MSEFIAFLPPPGAALNKYDSKALHTTQPSDVPEVFRDAMSVREEVYVEEQKVPLENEFDFDDPRSYHWVAYASVGTSSKEQAEAAVSADRENQSGQSSRKGSTANKLAVGTIRMVPPPHPPHPEPNSHHAIDNHDGLPAGALPGSPTAETYDGEEPYVKLGRLAVLPAFRGLGLARLLINAALSWLAQHYEEVVPPLSPAAAEQRKLELGQSPERVQYNGLVLVHAQTTVEKVWAQHGFVRDESMGVWYEEGIEHIGMWRRIELDPRATKSIV